MKLDTEFYRLPLRFDAARLAAEVSAFSESEWREHPQKHVGNSAIPLISVGGGINDQVQGPMRPTPYLDRCPYLRQVLASFRTPLGRARLMRIAGQGDATMHVDTNYYWMHHVRIHVPAVTWPPVRFVCNEREVHMAAGESWIFDSWKPHNVINPVSEARIHVVADTVGSGYFWDELVAGAHRPFDPRPEAEAAVRVVPFSASEDVSLGAWLENVNFPVVMSPWEQDGLIARIEGDIARAESGSSQLWPEVQRVLRRFRHDWHSVWVRHGEGTAGWPEYERLRLALESAVARYAGKVHLPNGAELVEIVQQMLIRPALNPQLATAPTSASAPVPVPPANAPRHSTLPATSVSASQKLHFERPVFIVAAPRSGSSLLFETLAQAPEFVTVGGESHELIESIDSLQPAARAFGSNRLAAEDATPEICERIRENFRQRLLDRDGHRANADAASIRLLEKTPKNALRIPFLRAIFPDAVFIYLHREPHGNLASIIDAWASGGFVTYPRLPGWAGAPWSLLLIPGWRELAGAPPEEIAAAQYRQTHEQILADLGAVPSSHWTSISYEAFLADPAAEIARLCRFADVTWDRLLHGPLPLSRHTLTPPDPEKWRRHEAAINRVLPALEPLVARLQKLPAMSESVPSAVAAAPASSTVDTDSAAAKEEEQSALRSIHTNTFPQLLEQLGISLVVSTYQAGKVVILRAHEGKLNTHFQGFAAPMGIAFDGSRLALGTQNEVHLLPNQPAVARKLPGGPHDACFIRRSTHVTGDIRIHEIAWTEDDLWIVNTRFSCLCTLDTDYSFVPRWRPSFISALSPEDRCHLNGMAIVDEQPRYVTCLGENDSIGGWRENKRSGGLLIDVPSREIITTGLSMPHSPRWHDGRLWVMESGKGEIGTLDLATGKVEPIASLPGFTRGLDFYGPFAFVGLSQVRESAVFSGLPLTERLQERTCGIWVIDTRTGNVVAFLKFEDQVQEIFAVQVLPGIRFPEIVSDDAPLLGSSFILPDEALPDVAPEVLAAAE